LIIILIALNAILDQPVRMKVLSGRILPVLSL